MANVPYALKRNEYSADGEQIIKTYDKKNTRGEMRQENSMGDLEGKKIHSRSKPTDGPYAGVNRQSFKITVATTAKKTAGKTQNG